jgi:hypothetical protein
MSTAAISSNSISQELQSYLQQRGSDAKQLGEALQSGNLADAQQEYAAIQTLAQSGPFANGNAFAVTQRQQDFAAVGQALQAGDLAGAQQAFAQLRATFTPGQQDPPQAEPTPAVIINIGGSSGASSTATSSTSSSAAAAGSASSPAASTASGAGSEIVLNLGNVTAGEQITIGLSNSANGGEQVTIGVADQQGQSPEQITLNLNQNSNQEIVLNLFNSAASSTTQGSGVNVTA